LSGLFAAFEPLDEPIGRRCIASSENQSPSVGLAVVDSMLHGEIKGVGSHAQGFYSRHTEIARRL